MSWAYSSTFIRKSKRIEAHVVNAKPEHDMRLAVTHETSSDEAETQINSWLKSFDDANFNKKRNQLRDTVFVSEEPADVALDDIMSCLLYTSDAADE